MEFYAELELPGLGKIANPIKIKEPVNRLEFPVGCCIFTTGMWRDIEESAHLTYKRYVFVQRGMYPSAWAFGELDEHGKARPEVKAFTVIYELGEIV